MALTKVSLVDLNAGELILDLDADTSITADTDDTVHIKIGGSDEITITGTALSPSTSDGNALGTSALEWSDLFLADGAVINFGDDQDVSLTHVADTGLLLSSTDQLQFGDSGTYIHQSADGVLDLVSDTEIEINATTIDMNGALDVSGTITSGGVITGTAFTAGSAVLTEAELETLDGVTVGTAIASKVVTTDANIDTTGQRNLTISGELDAATGDFSGDVDIDGTANLDTVDIDGATQIDATVTVGVDDTGYDVKFFGDTSGAHMLWDASVDDLILAGAGRVVVPEGNLVLGSTAVTSTAAELNLLDGVSGLVQADLTKLAAIDATATEINFIDGGATIGTTAVADGDGIIHNDGGTMKVTTAATFKTYFQEGLSSNTPSSADGQALGSASLEWSDLFLADSGTIQFGNDQDTILTHTDGAGLTLNSTNKLMFNDASQFIQGASATVLDIAATDEIELTATLIEVVGNATVSGTTVSTGVVTANAGVVVDNITIDGTEIDLSSGDLTVDVAGDIILDAGGGDFKFQDDGTHILSIVNSSSDVIIKPIQDNKDIIFQQRDGTEVARVGNNANFSIKDNLNMNSDASQINFGVDGEASIIHNHDAGLTFKSNRTGDNAYPIFNFHTGETNIEDNELLGVLNFAAPDEAAGTDATTVAAAIYAKAEADFTSTVNKTKLVFQTATSGAADDKLSILNDGRGLSPFTARAWAQWDGTTIKSSHNVSSVANPNAGKYTVNFTNNMPNDDYATAGMAHADRFLTHENAPTTSDIDLTEYNSGGSLESGNYQDIIIFSTGT